MREDISVEYFEWLFVFICNRRFGKGISYRGLLTRLHETEFTYKVPRDRNRAEDGIDLRLRFISLNGYGKWRDEIMDILDGPCSVLEMMIALAVRCEENIMDDPRIGDRTKQWFWEMVSSLGLNGMTDDRLDIQTVDTVIERFLNRDYAPNGEGGLFTIRHCDVDVRKAEIWVQLCWYLDTII